MNLPHRATTLPRRLATGPRRLATVLTLAACLTPLAACNTVGPRAVQQAGIEYNQAMNAAYNEQVLLNLVRLRYRDAPFFLEPTELITSHVLGAETTASATLGAGAADVDLSATGTYEENPTVIYTPLSGEAFLERLLTPVQVETLYLLMRSGWSIERVLRCCVRQMNDLLNAPSADGPTPSYAPEYRDFRRVAEELRRLQKSRDLMLDSELTSEAKASEEAEGGAEADAKTGGDGGSASAGNGDDSGEEEDEAAERVVDDVVGADEDSAKYDEMEKLVVALTALVEAGKGAGKADDEAAAEPEETRSFYLVLEPSAVRALEGLDEVQRKAVLERAGAPVAGTDGRPRTRLQLVPEQRSGTPGTVALHTRSLMGVLYFLSQAVEVPQDHVDGGLVTATAVDGAETASGRDSDPDALNPPVGECAENRSWACPSGRPCLDWTETVLGDLFRVRVAAKKPTGAYVLVPYRGHWFYIPDCDLQSKSTYLLLKQLFSLQAGNPKDRASVLNYSLGG